MTTIKKLLNLKGRRALITGATGGLGNIISSTLAELGADLVLIDLPGTDLNIASNDLINRWGVNVESFYCDLEKEDQRSELIASIKASKNLNILINFL